MTWQCKVCKKEYEKIESITRHLFVKHAADVISILPLPLFHVIGNVMMHHFKPIWKTLIRVKKDV